jgi:hypothetical protein
VDECSAKLGSAVRGVDEACRGRRAEQHAWHRERQRNDEVLDAERLRLSGGQARVSDLACAAEFSTGARARELDIEHRLTVAGERLQSAERLRSGARHDLEQAEAARLALGRHRARVEAAARKQTERQVDEESMDAHNLHHRRGER